MAQRPEKRVIRKARQQARQQRLLYGLKDIDVPMVPGIQVQNPLPDMQTPVAASPSDGIIYSDGPMDRFTAAHESAHLLEKRMTAADKKRFAKVMGIPNRRWEIGTSGAVSPTGESQGYRGSAGEIFADMTAMLASQYDPEGNKVVSGYMDKPPSRKQLLRLGRSLERFGKRNGLPVYARPRRDRGV